MFLTDAKIGQAVTVKGIEGKEKIKNFLVSLGCFEGEPITLISILSGNYIVNIKDSRYAIEKKIAKSILVEQ
ncbi:FeoA family protein [Bacillus benzoevorans]|uniref:Ferrous iron transport protein A n=1 Tax=Bacillus benzoevorans TaxID=1456 RepID=A0A7X0HNH6_9BACI|nr:FeoA family protein [Bacillus benzoevorans]MBB6443949.1 ferrous iron transport protein A [Bacillus benzoevorans]